MKFNPQETFRKQPMVYITAGLIIGILLNKLLNIAILPTSVFLIFITILIIILIWKYYNFLLILLMITLGISILDHQNHDFNESLKEIIQFSNKQVVFRGIIHEVNNYSSGQRYILENLRLKSEDIIYTNNFKYLVYPKDQFIDNLSIGDTLRGNGKWQLFSDIRNPDEYEFKKYYNNKKIAGKIYSKGDIEVYSNANWTLIKSINNFREVVRSKLTAYSDGETAALLSALILGDRTQIDQDLRNSFANDWSYTRTCCVGIACRICTNHFIVNCKDYSDSIGMG